jgi:hypothetical protein
MLDASHGDAYTSSAFMAENDLRAYYLFAMKAMADITGTLLVPGLLAVLLRSVYDHLAYEQLIFFISLAVVFVLSMLTLGSSPFSLLLSLPSHHVVPRSYPVAFTMFLKLSWWS